MSLSHFTILVPLEGVDGMANFLGAALQHLGFKEMLRPIPNVVGMGVSKPYLWLWGIDVREETFLKQQHTAFSADNEEQVQAFHAAAIKAGGTCNGKPGLRPEYHPGYYAAFVRDPVCGINFEVVYHGSQQP